MNVLYLDLIGGISGDMCAGALVDLGVPLALLRERLDEAGVQGVTLETRREERHHIGGTRFLVTHGEGASPDGGVHRHRGSDHRHRAWRDIDGMLATSRLPVPCRDLARTIFRGLAEAEGAIHGIAPERVEFHEVGAWDSIADIVCSAAGLVHLGAERVLCSPVPLGAGQVTTAHGILPVPAPATLRLLAGFPVMQGGPPFERTTPTGAAILAAVARPAPDPFAYVPERIGIGIGKAERTDVPNLLRAVLGRVVTAPTEGATLARETVELAAANLDDCNPEWVGFAMERLFAAGALDVTLHAVGMKKNRPGTQVQVLYPPALRERILEVLFAEVTTLGVRFQTWERAILPRETATVQTPWGPVTGKLTAVGGRQRFAPEFEACRTLALARGVPLPEIYRAAEQAYAATGAVLSGKNRPPAH